MRRTLPRGITLAFSRPRILRDDDGAAAIGYALVAAGIGVTVAATIWSLGGATNSLYASVVALF